MKFSIIVPTFNRAKHLEKLVLSVINQSFTSWELIIVDDLSTDDTEIKIRQLENNNIRFHKRNSIIKGACQCRNEGLLMAEGEYVIFLDSDDELTSNCLLSRLRLIDGSAYNFVVSNGILKNQRNGSKYLWNIPTKQIDLERFLKLDSPWQTTGPTFRKSWLIKENILWDSNLNIWQDVDFHIQILSKTNRYFVAWDEQPNYIVNVNEVDSISRVDFYNPEKLSSQKYLFEKLKNNFERNLDTMFCSIFNSLLKTRRYSEIIFFLRAHNNVNFKKSIRILYWCNLILNIISFNRINVNLEKKFHFLESTIGKFEWRND